MSDWRQSRPLSQARTLPAELYHSSDIAEREAALFQRAPHCLAHQADIPLNTELDGMPLVLLRQAETVRCFEAVCRHRAGPLECHGDGLRCAYHGWRYDAGGRLVETPGFGTPEAFDPSRVRLPEHKLRSWQHWHWLRCEPEPPWMQACAGWLEPMEGLLARRQNYTIECNWKVYVENYLEGYHVACLHPGLGQQLAEDYHTEVHEDFSLQWADIDASATGRPGVARYVFIFPNLMLNILPGRVQLNQVMPLSPSRCQVRFDYQYADWVEPAQRREDQAQAHNTQLEDIAICERLQRNLASGSYRAGRLSPTWEAALMDFQDRYRASFG